LLQRGIKRFIPPDFLVSEFKKEQARKQVEYASPQCQLSIDNGESEAGFSSAPSDSSETKY